MPIDSKARVFVSHSSKDKPFVRKLVEELKKRPLNIWLDETELKVGDSIVSKISEGLTETDYLVVVLSKASVSSQWVQEELNAALASQLAGKGVVLPVLIEDCDVPVLLKDIFPQFLCAASMEIWCFTPISFSFKQRSNSARVRDSNSRAEIEPLFFPYLLEH
jgi:hypothetical protein